MHSIIIAIIVLILQRYWLSIPACFFQGSLDIEKKWCNYLSNCSSGNPSPSLFLHPPEMISLQRRAQHPPRKREILELRWLGLGKLSSLVPLDVQRSGLFVVSIQAHNLQPCLLKQLPRVSTLPCNLPSRYFYSQWPSF